MIHAGPWDPFDRYRHPSRTSARSCSGASSSRARSGQRLRTWCALAGSRCRRGSRRIRRGLASSGDPPQTTVWRPAQSRQIKSPGQPHAPRLLAELLPTKGRQLGTMTTPARRKRATHAGALRARQRAVAAISLGRVPRRTGGRTRFDVSLRRALKEHSNRLLAAADFHRATPLRCQWPRTTQARDNAGKCSHEGGHSIGRPHPFMCAQNRFAAPLVRSPRSTRSTSVRCGPARAPHELSVRIPCHIRRTPAFSVSAARSTAAKPPNSASICATPALRPHHPGGPGERQLHRLRRPPCVAGGE
jgi:hypothetical protein